jgi:glycosyltransferase involved in cell wall biosynthesis
LSVSVIIPAFDEEDSIGRVLTAIPRDWVQEIVVVDGGSTDNTTAIARTAGARVICEPQPGYGRACAVGAAAAGGDILVFLDADGADDPGHIPNLLAPILAGQADMVLGSRLTRKMAPDAMPWHQRFGNQLAARLIRWLHGLPLTDLSPFRAIRRESLLVLGMEEMTYGWPTEMIVKGALRELRIVEVAVPYRPRLGGHSKISGTVRGTVLAAYHILRTIFRYARGGVEPND